MDFSASLTAAYEATGLKDLGGPELAIRARQWFVALREEARLSQTGTAVIDAVVTGWLINRLRLVDDLKRYPAILSQPIRQPIFVTGMPRTGTTKLQRILASDRDVQSLPFWQILNLAPIPGVDSRGLDPRIAIAEGYVESLARHFPDFLTAHPAFTAEPEEESFLIEADFQSLANCTRVRAPRFWRQIKDSPNRESYEFLKIALQYVQWQRGADAVKPWVLKSPLHVGQLDALFRVFPDALVVHTIRDPLVALPSNCRIVEVFRGMSSDDIDLHELGAEQLAVWSGILKQHLEQRERIGDQRIVDAHYEDINADVVSVVRAAYARQGRTLGVEAESQMRYWEQEHPQHQFGQHRYSLDRYGLSKAMIEAEFSEYRKRFI